MTLYTDYCLPLLIDKACGAKAVQAHREKIIPLAEGRVLEIGIGSGLNLPFYDASKVDAIWGLEPSLALRKKAMDRVKSSSIPVDWIDLPGEEIPLASNSVNTIVLTYTLCSIPDWLTALRQMKRVLTPDGKLLFSEHGAAKEPSIRAWQDKLTPCWKKIGGGCHLNRPIAQYIEHAGFTVQSISLEYTPHVPKCLGYNYRGIAHASLSD